MIELLPNLRSNATPKPMTGEPEADSLNGAQRLPLCVLPIVPEREIVCGGVEKVSKLVHMVELNVTP
jgi:hypothetical protein